MKTETTVTIISKAEINSNIKLPLLKDVPAGFPSPADDYVDNSLDLNELLIKHPNATYFVKVQGTSMINAGIFDGDILIVDRSLTVESNKIVIAVVDGEFTVKRIKKVNGKLFLVAENSSYKPIPLNENMELQIWGVVTNSIHPLY